MASDYGDPQDEEEEEGEHGKQKKEKGLLSLEEERVLSEFKQREVDLQESVFSATFAHPPRY